jgi:hypothetical protein
VKKLNRKYSFKICITIISCLFFHEPSYAYIDPGTTSVVYTSFAYILAAAAVAISVLIAPFKMLYKFIKEKGKGENK